MSEQNTMTEENKKTIIAFIAGLLVGGLLVFIFSTPAQSDVTAENNNQDDIEVSNDDEEDDEEDGVEINPTNNTTPAIEIVSGGSVTVEDQAAGNVVNLSNVEFPVANGWIGVRDYEDGQLLGVLGAARFSLSEGLTPNSVRLLRNTEAGKTYAVVFFSDNGDRIFNMATDVQLGGTMETFMVR